MTYPFLFCPALTELAALIILRLCQDQDSECCLPNEAKQGVDEDWQEKSSSLPFLLTMPAGLVLVPKQAGVWCMLVGRACIFSLPNSLVS